MTPALLDEVLTAHGGLERWRSARSIRARVRSGGLLLATRMPGNRLAEYEITLRVAEPFAELEPFPRDGERAVFDSGRVHIEKDGGELVQARRDPRRAFFGLSGLRRNVRWDALDSAYFAGYAMWNYLTTPLLLRREGVLAREADPWSAPGGKTWRRLEMEFPARLDTHCPRQTFYVDSDGLLRRHDYTAQVIGGWAKAAHALDGHRSFDGLVFPTRRRVTPRGPANRALPGPALVWIELASVSVESG